MSFVRKNEVMLGISSSLCHSTALDLSKRQNKQLTYMQLCINHPVSAQLNLTQFVQFICAAQSVYQKGPSTQLHKKSATEQPSLQFVVQKNKLTNVKAEGMNQHAYQNHCQLYHHHHL
jgi:hypothetical protein